MSQNLSSDSTGPDDRSFDWGAKTYVMGILNLSPDSFSGDGMGADLDEVIRRAHVIEVEGADIIDIGGQSTRPGHVPISAEEEFRRVIPALEAISGNVGLPVSVDTSRASVAEAALKAGAHIINDVRGLSADPELGQVVARWGVPLVLMHDIQIVHRDRMIPQMIRELSQRIDYAVECGIAWERLIIDPGFGFGKQPEMNLELLRRLDELKVFGLPILSGTSRKSTIGKVLDVEPDERVEGTAATVAIAIEKGADIVRVHDVRQMVRVARMTDAIVRGTWHEHISE